MDRKEFIRFAQKTIDKRYFEVIGRSLRPKEVEVCLMGLLESILQVLESGDEVRLIPFGVLYPRVICREGQVVSAKIAFSPFVESNDRLVRCLQKLPIFSQPDDSSIRVTNAVAADGTQHLRIYDERGRELYSVTDIAKMLNLSTSTVYKSIERLGSQVETVENNTAKKYPRATVDLLRGPKKKSRRTKTPPEGMYTLEETSRRVGVSNVTIYEYKRKFPNDLVAHEQGVSKFYDENFIRKALLVKKYGSPVEMKEPTGSWG